MGFKALLRAMGEEKPSKRSQQSEASELAAVARAAKKEERDMNTFFGKMKQLKEFEKGLKDDIIEEQSHTQNAVEQALAGFIEGQQQEELVAQGFHPDSTPTERMSMQALNVFSQHLAPWTAPKPDADSLYPPKDPMGSTNQSPPPQSSASLEDLAIGLPPPPPPPGNQTAIEGPPQPGNVDHLMSFLETMGLTTEQLAMFGVFPEKIDPQRMSMGWLKNAAALVRQLQVE